MRMTGRELCAAVFELILSLLHTALLLASTRGSIAAVSHGCPGYRP